MRYVENILGTVGDTPLVRLSKVTEGIPATFLAKVESFNPGGSVKDRIGLRMIDAAERERRGITEGTLRLSVGIEDIGDVLEDIDRALTAARAASVAVK